MQIIKHEPRNSTLYVRVKPSNKNWVREQVKEHRKAFKSKLSESEFMDSVITGLRQGVFGSKKKTKKKVAKKK